MTTAHIDSGRAVVQVDHGIDALIALVGAAVTYLAGTLLGRKLTAADTYLGVIVGTGVKTINLTALAGRSLKPGAYVLTVGNVTAGVGPGTLVDPDGLSASVTLAVSGNHDVPSLGVRMALTAGGTELDDGATVTFTVAAPSGIPTYVAYSPTGVNGAQVASAVVIEDVTGTNESISRKVLSAGIVNRDRLIVHGVGAPAELAVEQLRYAGIYAQKTTQLAQVEGTE